MKKIKGIAGYRLDKFLAEKCPDISRAKIQNSIKSGKVLVNGKPMKSSYQVTDEDDISIEALIVKEVRPEAEDVHLDILYEDKSCFVINKPAGVVIHPGEDSQNLEGTIVNAILPKLSKSFRTGLRPGIVHRLDKDTSGVLLIAKNQKAYENLVNQFQKRTVEKHYLALVYGRPEHSKGIIDSPIGRDANERKKMSIVSNKAGKQALTIYEIDKEYQIGKSRVACLLKVEIKTGRTHQIRVHLAAIGHPVLGDTVYGNKHANKLFREEFGLRRQFLHAEILKFVSPATGESVNVKAALSEDLNTTLESI